MCWVRFVECSSQLTDAVVWRTTWLVRGIFMFQFFVAWLSPRWIAHNKNSSHEITPQTQQRTNWIHYSKVSSIHIYIYIVCSIFSNPATYTCMCVYIYICYPCIHTTLYTHIDEMYVSYLATSQTVSMETRWLAYSLVVIRVWRCPLQWWQGPGGGGEYHRK